MIETMAGLIQAGYEFYLFWSPPVHEMAVYLYSVLFFPVLFFSSVFYFLAFSGLFKAWMPARALRISSWPRVSIHIPTLNELVALRCAKRCLNMDYPKDRYEVIIGDDSDEPEVSRKINEFAKKHPGIVKVTRRKSREGFKAGNLNHMVRHSSGEIVVTFDSDFEPERDFLKKVIPPFVHDEDMAYVQTKWKYTNMDQNTVSRFATAVLMVYHNLLACINSRLGVPLLFGSGQAVRKDFLVESGGWKEGSLTEDVDFSLRALKAGYKGKYISNYEVAGEVPFTAKGFFRQQKRWAFGNARAFLDYKRWLLFGKGLNPFQRLSITATTVGYIASPFLVLFMVFGTLSFMTGEPDFINIGKLAQTTGWTMIVNSGFVTATVVALVKESRARMFFHVLAGSLTIGIYTSFGVTSGFIRAVLGRKVDWYMIRKLGNEQALLSQ